MIRYFFLSFVALIFCLLLSSCQSMNPSTTKRALCNTLKSHLVFNGSTSNTRAAEIQNAEGPLQQKMYDQNNCDQPY